MTPKSDTQDGPRSLSDRAIRAASWLTVLLLLSLSVWAFRREFSGAAEEASTATPTPQPADGLTAKPAVTAKSAEESRPSEIDAPRAAPLPAGTTLTPMATYEAEAASIRDGALVFNEPSASGGKAVEINEAGSILWKLLNVPAAGTYYLTFRYRLPHEKKQQLLVVNGERLGDVAFDGPAQQWHTKSVPVPLKTGTNLVSIKKNWGWMQFDFLRLEQAAQ